ncbi:MAG: response regulator [bacterium]
MKNSKLLIIDDDEKLRFNLSLFFDDEGFDCIAVDTAEKALKLIEVNRFGFAIVDLRLPGINGVEFVLKANLIDPAMSCFFYTGSNEFILSEELKKIGLTPKDIFLKPISDMKVILYRIMEKLEL